MSNDYYNATGAPATGSPGASSVMRSEFASIVAAFDRLPTLTGNANKLVVVNGSATALVVSSKTLPTGDFVGTTDTQTLTNKTLTAPVLGGTVTGTYTLGGTPTLTNPVINGFTGSTAVVNIGSGQIYKATDGKVGIGTTSPNQRLSIAGGAVEITDPSSQGVRFTVLTNNGSAGISSQDIAYGYDNDGDGASAATRAGVSWGHPAASLASFLSFWTTAANGDATEKARFDSFGNLGIGTTSPATLINIKRDQNSETTFRIDNQSSGNAAASVIDFYTSGAGWSLSALGSGHASGANAFTVGVSGNERLRITNGGNVGIGTTTPDVFGRVAVLDSGSPPLAYASILSNTSSYSAAFESTLYLGARRTDIISNGFPAGYRIKVNAPSPSEFGSYFAIESASSASGASSPPNVFTERMRIDSAGNVGIGVNNPSSYNEYARTLVVGKVGNTAAGITIVSDATGTGAYSSIYFANGFGGTAAYRAGLEYSSDNGLIQLFGGAGANVFRVQNAAGSFTASTNVSATTYPAFFARAWVNFNGTGTVAIRASGNVSSITDGGTGIYGVNLTTAMPDTNCASFVNTYTTTNAYSEIVSTVQIGVYFVNEGVFTDEPLAFVALFR
jgi:hypothetical protein